MRFGSATTVAVAILFGLLAVFLARSMMPAGPSGNRVHRTIVVASRPIALGAQLGSDNLKTVDWASEAPLEGSFPSVADVLQDGRRLALSSFQANEPLFRSKVTPPNGRATLSTQIEPGMRAVSIRVDEVRGVAGFVAPGDRVDVILTRGETGTTDAGAYADVLLQDAKVLAVDQIATDRQDKPTVARAVTLELPIADAQKVILAQGIGRLSLVLRQAGEAAQATTARVTATALSGVADAAAPGRSNLEKKLDELTKRLSEYESRPAQPAPNLAEMEARLRAEMNRAPTPAAQPRRPTVSVTRNATKREEYSVLAEP